MYWSPSKNGFFDPALQSKYVSAGTWPADAVPVDDEAYRALMAAQMAGQEITSEGGVPVARDPEPPSIEQRRARMKCARAQGIAVLGEANWSVIEAVADDPETDWPTRAFIRHAETWHRTSPKLNDLAPLLGLSDEDMDNLFIQAEELQL